MRMMTDKLTSGNCRVCILVSVTNDDDDESANKQHHHEYVRKIAKWEEDNLTVYTFDPSTHNLLLLLLLLLLLHPFNGFFSRTTWVSRNQKDKTSLDLNEARDDGGSRCSGFSWTICKQSAPRSRQITTPTRHHSIFTGGMLFLTPNQQSRSTEGTQNLLQVKMTTGGF